MAAASPGQATATTIEQMPAKLETQFALSAVPSGLRDRATVYLLDPKRGYHLSRQGTNGVTCLVERTVWEWVDFRNDIYIPLCYDAVGTKGHLKVIMDTATLRARGMSPVALKAEIENRYKSKTYKAPEKPGLSYMVAPVMRALGPPDMKMHTMSMPHLMFYAPNVTNEDIGAVPDLSVPSSLLYPFIDKQGNAEQSYMIQLIGEAEKAKILADENALVDELCAYRDILCLADKKH
jgi:DNA-binding phage protein